MPVTKAAMVDIPALVSLLNSAYRGEASTRGWTTEAHLLKGELRTDTSTLTKELTEKDAAFLKYTDEAGKLTGCVYLRKQDSKMYLGMLSVDPAAQSQGVGKKLLKAADEYAVANHCTSIYMTVISARHELIDWYKRHGYALTGERKPFLVDQKFGIPTQELEFAVLAKNV